MQYRLPLGVAPNRLPISLEFHPREQGFVPCNQHTVTGHHQIGLDEIGPLINGSLIGGQGVLWQLARGTSMGNHERAR